MKTPILLNKNVSIVKFIEYWSSTYIYANGENKYLQNIVKTVFDNASLLLLFEWKNGSVLSGHKRKSFEKNILSKIKIINTLKTRFDFDIFKKEFENVSTIWKIFLLHIIKPDTYPIFDQHVFRAMSYIKFGIITEIPSDSKEKERIYVVDYVVFFNKFRAEMPNICESKKIDEALWSFGKFLKSNYGKVIINNI